MIRHDLYSIGETRYGILNTPLKPEIMIPIKFLIHDVKHDDTNPLYLVEIKNFYDHFYFIKKHYVNMPVRISLKNTNKKNYLKEYKSEFKNNKDILKKIHDNKYYIVIESIYCFFSKPEMLNALNDLTDFYIMSEIKKLKYLITKPSYKGKFKMSLPSDYYKSLNRFFDGCKHKDQKMIDKFLEKLKFDQ